MKDIPAYNPAEIERKWQDIWEEQGTFRAEASHEKPKFYPLIEFPYPSGAEMCIRDSPHPSLFPK